MDVHDALVAVEVVSPHRFEQLSARVDPTGRSREGEQQVELERREGHRPPVDAHLSAQGVQGEAAHPHDGVLGLALLRAGASSAQHTLDPGDDFAGAERLGHVVVGAHLQPDDAIDLFGARGHKDDVDLRRPSQDPQDLEAVEVRQPDVEQDQVGRGDRGAGAVQGVGAGVGLVDDEAGVLEIRPQHLADAALVIDDEDASLHGGLLGCSGAQGVGGRPDGGGSSSLGAAPAVAPAVDRLGVDHVCIAPEAARS